MSQKDFIKKGSLVSISVFPKNILYSPYGLVPIVKDYVAYGFEEIEDFFIENSLYTRVDLIKTIEEPFYGIVLEHSEYKIKKAYNSYHMHSFYKIFIDAKKNQYWFSKDDIKII